MSALAGLLSERVTIELRDPARDAAGGAIGDWSAQATVWAAVAPDGTDPADGRARPRWRVTLRARDLSVEARLRWGQAVLAIRDIVRDPRSPDRMTVHATEQA